MAYLVRYYKNDRGDEPVRNFINKQDKQTQSKYARTYRLLAEYGPQLLFPHTKHVMGEIYELRLRGKKEIRIFYAWHSGSYFLLHAFQKKSDKITEEEINIARKRCLGCDI